MIDFKNNPNHLPVTKESTIVLIDQFIASIEKDCDEIENNQEGLEKEIYNIKK